MAKNAQAFACLRCRGGLPATIAQLDMRRPVKQLVYGEIEAVIGCLCAVSIRIGRRVKPATDFEYAG